MPESRSPADILTERFYNWEMRGRGWQVWPVPVVLEPPFRPFIGHFLPSPAVIDDGQFETAFSRLAETVRSFFAPKAPPTIPPRLEETEEPEPEFIKERNGIVELQVSLPPSSQSPRDVFEQCLMCLGGCRHALAFEVVGTSDALVAQIAADEHEAVIVRSQLKAHFPEVVITTASGFLAEIWARHHHTEPLIVELGLDEEFMVPLETMAHMATDPLVGITAALEQLDASETAVYQVLFEPVRHRWAESILRAVTTGNGESFFENAPELVAQAKQKVARPLVAAVLRVAVASPRRTFEIGKNLVSALGSFTAVGRNRLIPLSNHEYDLEEHVGDFLERVSRRLGMILNTDELASLAHLPTAAVRSRKLRREIRHTKSPPEAATAGELILGTNVHEGVSTEIRVTTHQRVRHTHLVGASGTGKSTSLLSMLIQDIRAGNGVGVLDPHGDLIDQLIGHIPKERFPDVVYVDPSDEDYPIGFNILSAHSNLEKNLLASDLVAVFQRLSTSWGDQMTSVLGNAILAFLESPRGGTLPELRRFLIEPGFRETVLATVTDPDIVYYWQREFPLLKTGSLGPLLTRLDTFLRPKTIRYMVAQRTNRLDFGAIMNQSKIFLAKLPQGLIGEENAYLLGSLLVSKFHQLAITRQQLDASERRPFWLFVDEFHHFMTPSMATILSGARKYQLGLVLAHQELGQLGRNRDVASAVMTNPCIRVAFRVGDEDAKRLAEGFSEFSAKDLQSLGVGEAICRVERSDWDFNIETTMPPPVDRAAFAQALDEIRKESRNLYGQLREVVEAELAEQRYRPGPERVDPFAGRSTQSQEPRAEESPKAAEACRSPESASTPKPSVVAAASSAPPKDRTVESRPEGSRFERPSQSIPGAGRGGPIHREHQRQLGELAKGLGYIVDIEKTIAGGSVDIALERAHRKIACEISVTTEDDHEIGNIRKCLGAGFDLVLLVTLDRSRQTKLRRLAERVLETEEFARVRFCLPHEAAGLLVEIAAETSETETVVHGRKTKVSYRPMGPEETHDRRERLAAVAAASLRNAKRSKGG